MSWIQQLFWRRRIEADLSEEIRSHLDERIDELVSRGVPREDAVRQARREFGNVTFNERVRSAYASLLVLSLSRYC